MRLKTLCPGRADWPPWPAQLRPICFLSATGLYSSTNRITEPPSPTTSTAYAVQEQLNSCLSALTRCQGNIWLNLLVRERKTQNECAFDKMTVWKTRLESSLTSDHIHTTILPVKDSHTFFVLKTIFSWLVVKNSPTENLPFYS